MCGLKKKVLASAELAAIAGATPAAAAAAAAAGLEDVVFPAADGQKQQRAAAMAGAGGGGKQHKQRKMSSGAAAAAAAASGTVSGKRRRGETPAAAPAASPAAGAAIAAAAAPGGWTSSSGGPGSGSWVLLGSSLSAAGRQQLAQLAEAAGATVAKEWGSDVTHVVCGTVDGAARWVGDSAVVPLARGWVAGEACQPQQVRTTMHAQCNTPGMQHFAAGAPLSTSWGCCQPSGCCARAGWSPA